MQLDAMGGKTTTEYNLRGFATAVRSYNTDGSGTETLYEYNGEGMPVKMSTGAIGSSLKHTTTYNVDSYGRVISETDPSGNSQYFEYDNNGNLIKSIDRMGIITESEYNALGNLVHKENSGGSKTEYTYNSFGELLNVTDESSSKSYTYNAFGDVTSAKDGYTIETFEYTADGALSKRIATDKDLQDNITTYQYNPAGRLVSVTTPLGTEQISYDSAGRVTAKSNETSGIAKTYSYYTGGLVKRIDTLRDDNLIHYEYNEYNPAGNKTYTDLNGNIIKYTYDGLNRLASVEENGKTTVYEFDEYNNISSKYELTDTTLSTTSYFYDNNNRLLLEESGNNYIRYEYDNSGNLLQKLPSMGAASYYKYDGYGRLKEVITGDSIAEYTYAPDGLRQSKTVNGKYTRFVYENGSVSAEITEGNTYNYYRGTELMGYTTHTGDLYYYISDSHGNIVSVTDVLGVNKKDYTYDAYGNQKAFTINPQGDMSVVYQWQSENENIYNPFRYCGEYTDEETGFVYLRNRYYDSTVGRFITEDPAKDGLNWYVYCGNNPVMFVDPTGYITQEERNMHAIGEMTQDVYDILIDLTNRYYSADTQAAKDEIHKLAEQFRNNNYKYQDLTIQANNQLWENGQKIYSMRNSGFGVITDIVALSDAGLQWYSLVGNNKEWDYKKKPALWMPKEEYFMMYGKLISFADFGNINYGYTGTALGLSPKTLYKGAGYVQSGVINNDASQYYGDSEVDFGNVKKGIEWANESGYVGVIPLPLELIYGVREENSP